MGSPGASKIVPVIDLGGEEMRPGTCLWDSRSKAICDAFEELGCFIAVYDHDKLSPQLHEEIFCAAEQVLNLPTDVLSKNAYGGDKPFHGYIGNSARSPLYESIGIIKATDKQEIEEFANLMWPHGNHSFCEISHSFAKVAQELDRLVVRMMFDNYGIDASRYEVHTKMTSYLLRLIKYRGVNPEKKSEVGATVHTDKTFTSILHHNYVSGLEIQTKEGEWIAVDFPPSTSCFVVLAGDVCTGWSNGKIRACVHRVTMAHTRTRYAAALFSHREGLIQVAEEFIDEDHPLMFRPFHSVDLLRFYVTEEGLKHPVDTVKAYCGL